MNHNYTKHLQDLGASGALGQPGTVTTVAIAHDSWCLIFKGAKCNCNPTLKASPTRPNRAERRKNR